LITLGAVLDNIRECYKGSHEEESFKQGKLIEHFVAAPPARYAACLEGVHRNIATYYFQKFRELVASPHSSDSKKACCGKTEIDESYLGEARNINRRSGALEKLLSCIWPIKALG